jgi:hypothetical protein
MPLINNQGSPSSQVWVIAEKPYDQDKAKGYMFSAGYGYVLQKMLAEAQVSNYFVTCRLPDTSDTSTYRIIENDLNYYKPPIIITFDSTLNHLCPFTKRKKGDVTDKYWGSLLTSPLLQYPHYVLPAPSPDIIVRDWSLRDITVSLDFGKIQEEIEFFNRSGRTNLQRLPEYQLTYDYEEDVKDGFDRLCQKLQSYFSVPLLSGDIESIYFKAGSAFRGHPGYPVTLGLASSESEGISFKLFRDSVKETRHLWQLLDKLFRSDVVLLGQNFFNFDAPRLEALGWTIDYRRIADTMIRQHILWPELSKKLEFMTKQYTRQPYYKSDGKIWSHKEMTSLKRYNCLDVCVTFAVYNKQEEEFNERPYLR